MDTTQAAAVQRALDRLPERHRRYVLDNVKRFRDYDYTAADVPSKTILLGPDFSNAPVEWAASAIHHEACHIEQNHTIDTPRRERDCLVRQADALDAMGSIRNRDYVLSLDGTYCEQTGAC